MISKTHLSWSIGHCDDEARLDEAHDRRGTAVCCKIDFCQRDLDTCIAIAIVAGARDAPSMANKGIKNDLIWDE